MAKSQEAPMSQILRNLRKYRISKPWAESALVWVPYPDYRFSYVVLWICLPGTKISQQKWTNHHWLSRLNPPPPPLWLRGLNSLALKLKFYKSNILKTYNSHKERPRVLKTLFGSILTFWAPNGLFLRSELGLKSCFWVYSCSWTTFFSIFPSILTFYFDLSLGSAF